MKKLIIAAVILFFIAVIYVSVFALCKVAGEADRQMEMMHEQHMRELEANEVEELAGTEDAVYRAGAC